MSSIFSRIIIREIPGSFLYEDELCIVIRDIHPQARTHLLIIPKKEIETIDHVAPEDMSIISHLFTIAQKITRDLGIERGYKLHFNVWTLGGQEIPHVHMHLMSDLDTF
jgi:histidine triad (HIT) family protein